MIPSLLVAFALVGPPADADFAFGSWTISGHLRAVEADGHFVVETRTRTLRLRPKSVWLNHADAWGVRLREQTLKLELWPPDDLAYVPRYIATGQAGALLHNGDIGPIDVTIDPWGGVSLHAARPRTHK